MVRPADCLAGGGGGRIVRASAVAGLQDLLLNPAAKYVATMSIRAIDVQVEDVSGATKLLADAYGWRVLSDDANFGELDAGGVRVMLSREAMVPWETLGGVILHEYVDDVARAVERAVAAGAELLAGPLTTDWGTEAAYLKGPGALIVDVCRDA
jgi:uncharacterized glyoxalase superfamily protein PhnB